MCFKNPLGLFLEKLLFLSGGTASRALFITDFSLSLLSAFGFNYFFKIEAKQKKKIFFSILILIIFFLFSVFLALSLKQNYRVISIRNLIIPIASFLACTLIILATIKFKRFASGQLLLIITIFLQLFYSADKYLPYSKQELLFPTTPVIDFLKQKKSERVEPFRVELGDVIPQNFLMSYGIETTSGYDTLLPKKTAEFLSLLEEGKVEKKISRVYLITNYDSTLFPLLNTKYILAKKKDKNGSNSLSVSPPEKFLDSRYKLVFEDKTVVVLENKSCFPRASFFYDYEIFKDDKQIADRLMEKDFKIKERVILDKDPKVLLAKESSPVNNIEWTAYQSNKEILRVYSSKPSILFISETFYPGWEALIDNQKTEIYRADFAFRGIFVPQGEHSVEFVYNPFSFKIGKIVSLLSLLIVITCLIIKKSHLQLKD